MSSVSSSDTFYSCQSQQLDFTSVHQDLIWDDFDLAFHHVNLMYLIFFISTVLFCVLFFTFFVTFANLLPMLYFVLIYDNV